MWFYFGGFFKSLKSDGELVLTLLCSQHPGKHETICGILISRLVAERCQFKNEILKNDARFSTLKGCSSAMKTDE
jgi:hypothetical protein